MNTLRSATPSRLQLVRACAFALLSCAASAQTTLINIDINASNGFLGTHTGAAASSESGTSWNGLPVGNESPDTFGSFTSAPLFTSTGTPTPITFSLGNYKVYEANEQIPALAPALMTDFVYQPILGLGGPDSTFAIANLDLTATYDIYFYAQNGGYANTSTIFTINGLSRTAVNTGNLGSFTLDDNYVLYTGLVPNASGTISGTFNVAEAANNAAFNGLQIVQHGAPPPPPPKAASTIKVDFNSTDGALGTYSGQAVAPQSAGLWNGAGVGAEGGSPLIGNFSSGPLSASDGSQTAVTFTLGNFRIYEADEQPAALAPSLMTDFVYQEVLGPGGPDSTFSLGNLDGGFTYDLYLYSQNGGYAGAVTSFTIDGVTKLATGAGNNGDFIEGTNYVLFQGLSPDAFGNIIGTFNSAKDGDNAAFNGFELVQVPEPAALSFLACGGMLALVRRRRA